MKCRIPLLVGFITIVILFTVNCSADSDEKETSIEPEPVYPHPDFDVSLAELKEEIQSEPAAVRDQIMARPEYFLELTSQFLELPEWARVLVDRQHPLPEGYAPEDLVMLNTYPLTRNRSNLQLSRRCMPAVLAMTEAARIDGIELVYSSTFRSFEYQKRLYEGYVASYGQEEADRFSAKPGTSQHQLGTAIDFGSITPEFGETAAGRWLYEHAWEYGFSLSYPEGKEDLTGYMFEIWHYRYITPTGTRFEREFFHGLQQQMLEFFSRHGRFFQENYQSST
jgi:zinc D-Ala-D-Ala carboxypeptidase